jgi:hypothetical protein
MELATESAVSAIHRTFSCDETNSCFAGMPTAGGISAMAAKLNEIASEAKACTGICDSRVNEIVYKYYAIARPEILTLRQQLAFVDSEEENAEPSEDSAGDVINITETETAKRILSVCVGAVFNRWSSGGIVPAKSYTPKDSVFELLGSSSPAETTGTKTGSAGLITDDPEHTDDIVRRVRDVFEEIWNDSALGIEREACELLNVKDISANPERADSGMITLNVTRRVAVKLRFTGCFNHRRRTTRSGSITTDSTRTCFSRQW